MFFLLQHQKTFPTTKHSLDTTEAKFCTFWSHQTRHVRWQLDLSLPIVQFTVHLVAHQTRSMCLAVEVQKHAIYMPCPKGRPMAHRIGLGCPTLKSQEHALCTSCPVTRPMSYRTSPVHSALAWTCRTWAQLLWLHLACALGTFMT